VLLRPYSQIMLEWDAARYNEAVDDYEQAYARLTAAINDCPETKTGREQRHKLLENRQRLIADFKRRANCFWHGNAERHS
jgi:hypothetical protein